jgi:hypothetical protein
MARIWNCPDGGAVAMSSDRISVLIEARLPKAISVLLVPLLKLIVLSTRMLCEVDDRILTSRDPPS